MVSTDVPTKLDLNSSSQPTEPQLLISDEGSRVYFQQDDRFFYPKGFLRLNLLTRAVNETPLDKTLSLLYALALNESLNEWNYKIALAGLNYSLVRTDYGIQLDFSWLFRTPAKFGF